MRTNIADYLNDYRIIQAYKRGYITVGFFNDPDHRRILQVTFDPDHGEIQEVSRLGTDGLSMARKWLEREGFRRFYLSSEQYNNQILKEE